MVSVAELMPLFVAGIAMTLVNRVLVAGVVALSTAERFAPIFTQDGAHHAIINVVLISIGSAAARLARDGVGVVVLLAAPVVAAYLMADVAMRPARLASHDTLTGLGNRDCLQRLLGAALADARSRGALGPGLVPLDLDRFKDINDTRHLNSASAGRLMA